MPAPIDMAVLATKMMLVRFIIHPSLLGSSSADDQ
jgi:hypothetical protein